MLLPKFLRKDWSIHPFLVEFTPTPIQGFDVICAIIGLLAVAHLGRRIKQIYNQQLRGGMVGTKISTGYLLASS